MMGVSIDLVRDIIGGFESTPSLIALEQHLALPRSTPSRKCSPPSDSGLGYILAQLRSNFTFVDVTSSERAAAGLKWSNYILSRGDPTRRP